VERERAEAGAEKQAEASHPSVGEGFEGEGEHMTLSGDYGPGSCSASTISGQCALNGPRQ